MGEPVSMRVRTHAPSKLYWGLIGIEGISYITVIKHSRGQGNITYRDYVGAIFLYSLFSNRQLTVPADVLILFPHQHGNQQKHVQKAIDLYIMHFVAVPFQGRAMVLRCCSGRPGHASKTRWYNEASILDRIKFIVVIAWCRGILGRAGFVRGCSVANRARGPEHKRA